MIEHQEDISGTSDEQRCLITRGVNHIYNALVIITLQSKPRMIRHENQRK